MKRAVHGIFALVALVVGFALGVKFASSSVSSEHPDSLKPPKVAAVVDRGGQASVDALRSRVRELETKLRDALTKVNSQATNTLSARHVDERGGMRPPRDMRTGLEQLRRDDPDRYTQITNRMAQMRRNRREWAAARMEFFASLDVSGMSKSARQNHERLQDLLARRDELSEQMADADLSSEERGKIFEQMRQNDRDIRKANALERDALLGETLKAVGIVGEDATEVAATLKDVFEATGDGRHGGHGGPPPGDSGAPPPPGP